MNKTKAIFYYHFYFRNPNSSDSLIVWNNTSTDNPKYLLLNGDKTCMVDGLLNGTRAEFWANLSEIINLKQKL